MGQVVTSSSSEPNPAWVCTYAYICVDGGVPGCACRSLAMKLTGLLLALAHLHGVLGLWPLPRSLQTGSSALKLASNFDIHVNVAHAPSDLEGAVSRTKAFLKNDKLGRLVVGRGTLDNNAVQRAGSLRTLELSLAPGSPVRSITDEARLAIGTRSEEYTLHIPADGSTATLTANSTLGLLRGLTTFEQLWYEASGQVYTMEAPVSISDSPAYVSTFVGLESYH